MKKALLFPGYGSQFVGMGKTVYDGSRIVQEYFEEAANCLDMNFVKLCFASSDIELGRMHNAYPALFLISSALCAEMKERGIIPDLIAGHDIGEYAALHSFGGLNFPDGLYFLSKYAAFYEELLKTIQVSGLCVRGISSDDLHAVCKDASDSEHTAKIAVYESATEHYVMGHMQAIDRIRDVLSDWDGVKIIESDIERGLHSELMDPVAAQLKLYSEKIDFKTLSVPLITNADAKIIEHVDDVKTAALKQIHTPIVWSSVIKALKDYDMIIQVGPGSHILDQVRSFYPDKNYFSVNKLEDIAMLKSLVASATQNNETDDTQGSEK